VALFSRYEELPERYRESMQRFIEHGTNPGHFLWAVLSNDLFDAVASADKQSQEDLISIVRWLFSNAPSASFGTKQKVALWQGVIVEVVPVE